MNEQDLRKLLKKTNDRLGILADISILTQYNVTINQLHDLVSDFLTDEEKYKLLQAPSFQNNPFIKYKIIELVSNEDIKMNILNDEDIVSGINNYQLIDIIKEMSDKAKQEILYNQLFIEKYKLEKYQLKEIISSFSDDGKIAILDDVELIKGKLQLENYQIAGFAEKLQNEEVKTKIIEDYNLEQHLILGIIETFSDESKIKIVLEDTRFFKNQKIDIIKSMDVNMLGEFIKENKEFCDEQDIHPYEIITKLDSEKQKDFIKELEKLNLSLNEKKEILAILNQEVKDSIDITNFSKEYKVAIEMKSEPYSNKIVFDLEKKLEDYKGLDNLIMVNPEKYTEEQRKLFMNLCDICPDIKVINSINDGAEFTSLGSEYVNGEKWIASIIEKLKPEYSQIQKMAIIDNEIGKKISYSPNFDTEEFSNSDSRALWKIIDSKYGVCNGIANIEQYIFNRIGIDSEIISSGSHAFLKIKNIEIGLESGETVTGNTILDPTWNLADHRFGARPNNFCISYEQARKMDIDIKGSDHYCHKNDEKLQDATLSLDDKSLRKIFTSVGLADENGKFPIKELLEESQLINETYSNDLETNVIEQFALLSKFCPEFATCQNSSTNILQNVLLNNEKMKFNKCVIDRVYDKKDEQKEAVLFVYMNSDKLGKKFYYANKEKGQMIELQEKEFIEQFECYESDLEKKNGIRPWEKSEKEEEIIDLSKSSGTIDAKEGKER